MEERLQKILSRCGFGSRRACEELIIIGRVTVNGTAAELGSKADPKRDVIRVDGSILQYTEPEKVYIMLNKPTGYITSVKDEQLRPTVMDLVAEVDARIFPVGRLDYNTSGLLIMTNDGDFAYKIAHPKHKLSKTYIAKIQGFLTRGKIAKLEKGIDIGGFVTSPAKVNIIKELPKHTLVELTIYEGKNRQVRKMFKALGNPVVELERIAIGDVRLGRLAIGCYRKLTQKEIEHLSKA